MEFRSVLTTVGFVVLCLNFEEVKCGVETTTKKASKKEETDMTKWIIIGVVVVVVALIADVITCYFNRKWCFKNRNIAPLAGPAPTLPPSSDPHQPTAVEGDMMSEPPYNPGYGNV